MTPSPNEISNQTQQTQQQKWIDKTNNIRILFSNVPAKPIIDSKTQFIWAKVSLT
jgi:aspartyl/asparaginyl beta-hydroxylase (cupin superfamily)